MVGRRGGCRSSYSGSLGIVLSRGPRAASTSTNWSHRELPDRCLPLGARGARSPGCCPHRQSANPSADSFSIGSDGIVECRSREIASADRKGTDISNFGIAFRGGSRFIAPAFCYVRPRVKGPFPQWHDPGRALSHSGRSAETCSCRANELLLG